MDSRAASIFNELKKSALKLGSCDPLWLRNEEEPRFTTLEPGSLEPKSGASTEPDLSTPDIVLLHGLFGALSNWDSTLPLFARFGRPTALQLPILSGHRSEVKVKALAAYTEYFVRSGNIAPVALCGNSLGGHVALRLCLASPQIVDCLILSGTSGLYEHSVDTLPIRPDKKFIRDHMARVFFNKSFITEEAVEEIHSILTQRTKVLNLIHAARSAKKDNLQDLLGQIKVPTLLLWGEDDEVTTMEVARMFNKLIPNSEMHTIKNCGHAPMIEYPEWFADHVETFLKKHSRFYKQKK